MADGRVVHKIRNTYSRYQNDKTGNEAFSKDKITNKTIIIKNTSGHFLFRAYFSVLGKTFTGTYFPTVLPGGVVLQIS